MARIDNLTPEAIADLREALRYSRTFDAAKALETGQKLRAHFCHIGQGMFLGHRRDDVQGREQLRFISVPPIVIAYDIETRTVLRILDGRQNIPGFFLPGSKAGGNQQGRE